ncbi:MAG: alcohol dehydrogenase catalytic domain-containing protein [Clostridiaceae bacterium]|nr:alcohol dehydrogenase catalytic domain-containing protein [Clostridiaceae bacterium]
MKSAYVKSPYQFEIRDIVLREIGPDEVLVKIKACGICGSDMHTASSQAPDWTPFGHEVAGIVEKIGHHVENIKAGDRVALESSTFCRYCSNCRNGRVDLCHEGQNAMANSDHGGFGEYIIAAKEQVVNIGNIPFEEAALIEPLGVAFDLLYTADIRLNDDVLVVGLGPIGLMALKLAKLSGARNVYAAARSTSEKRIQTAMKFGASAVIHTDKINLEEYRFARGGVDKVLVTDPPKTIPSALKVLNYGGIAAYLGFDFDEENITINANDFHFKRLQLRASFAAPALYFPRCIDMIGSGMFDVKELITHRFKLENIKQAMETLRDNKADIIKMVILE